jgi:nucleotide-binding universal stress UspA family protein
MDAPLDMFDMQHKMMHAADRQGWVCSQTLKRKEGKAMYKKMMVPLDGSELAECVLPHVEAFLKGFNLSDVSLVRVVEPVKPSYHVNFGDIGTPYPPPGGTLRRLPVDSHLAEQEEGRKASAVQYLEQVMSRLQHEGTALHAKVLVGRVTESLIDYAEQNHIDLIFIATHGRSGVTRWVRGSVADKILRAANVPVLMVRAPGTKGGI